MKVLALIFDGFEELEATAPFALLRRAKVSLTICSERNEVIGSHKLHYTDITPINEIDYKAYDALLIPGGAHWKFLETSSLVHEIIKYYMKNNRIVAAICAAPTIIGKLGLLKNRKYTCFTSMNEDFEGIFTNDPVTIDGNLITAKSAAASIDFAYEIINKLLGENKLKELQEQIYYEK